MKNAYQTALVTILVAAALPLSGWAQTAQQVLDRRKQSIYDNYKRGSDELSCSAITQPGPRKACVFWRDIYDEGAKCVRNSLTDKDVTDCIQKLQGDMKAMDRQPESWYDPQNAKWRDDARAASQDYEDTYNKYSRAGVLSQANLTKFDFRTPRLWKYRLRLQTDIRNARDFLTNDEAAGIVDDFKKTKAELIAAVAPAPTSPATPTTTTPTTTTPTTTTPTTTTPTTTTPTTTTPPTSGRWQKMSGAAKDIGVGANGATWVVSTNIVRGGYGIYRLDGNNWTNVPGGLIRIDVDTQGSAWGVNDAGNIYRFTGSGWQRLSGLAKDIGVGANGSVWVIGVNAVGGGFGIYRLDGNNWTNVPGGAVRIDVDPKGMPWVVNDAGNIYRFTGSGWQQMPGRARDIGIGGDGSVFVTAPDSTIHKWNGNDWTRIDGLLTDISVDGKGMPWGVNATGEIFRRVP